jgi:putative hemin transport protein
MDAKPEITPPTKSSTELTGSILAYFREDRSRMTMIAARKFDVPEQDVVEALIGEWPIVRLRSGVFRALMDALPSLGTMRVFVRSRAAVIESVGTFGGFSETGPFFNVQTDTLDMHILPAEIGAVFAVEKWGHDTHFATHSFQFFDTEGNAAFKAFLWENFPNVPSPRIEAFHGLTRQFSQPW